MLHVPTANAARLAACAHLTITVSDIERDICEKIVVLS